MSYISTFQSKCWICFRISPRSWSCKDRILNLHQTWTNSFLLSRFWPTNLMPFWALSPRIMPLKQASSSPWCPQSWRRARGNVSSHPSSHWAPGSKQGISSAHRSTKYKAAKASQPRWSRSFQNQEWCIHVRSSIWAWCLFSRCFVSFKPIIKTTTSWCWWHSLKPWLTHIARRSWRHMRWLKHTGLKAWATAEVELSCAAEGSLNSSASCIWVTK